MPSLMGLPRSLSVNLSGSNNSLNIFNLQLSIIFVTGLFSRRQELVFFL